MVNQIIEKIPVIIHVLLLLLLSYSSMEDIRYRKIHIKKIIISILIMILFLGLRKDISFAEGIAGVVPGTVLLLISKVTRGQIGEGDGMMLMTVGLGLGLLKSLQIMFFSLFLAAAYAVFLIIRYKKNRKQTFAFLPFLLLAFLLTI